MKSVLVGIRAQKTEWKANRWTERLAEPTGSVWKVAVKSQARAACSRKREKGAFIDPLLCFMQSPWQPCEISLPVLSWRKLRWCTRAHTQLFRDRSFSNTKHTTVCTRVRTHFYAQVIRLQPFHCLRIWRNGFTSSGALFLKARHLSTWLLVKQRWWFQLAFAASILGLPGLVQTSPPEIHQNKAAGLSTGKAFCQLNEKKFTCREGRR